jgi:drug/metabolite transporter (DMT)-like permease
MEKKESSLGWILLISLALIWGSSFMLMMLGMKTYSSGQVAGFRILFAFLFMVPFGFAVVKRDHLVHWKAFLATGVLGNFIPAFLFTFAETGISSSLASMLNAFTPVATLVTGICIWKIKPNRYGWFGVLLGIAGAAGLFFASSKTDDSQNLWYGIFVVIATIFYGLSVNIIRQYLNNVPSLTNAVWSILLIGPMACIYLPFSDLKAEQHFTRAALWDLSFVAVLGIVGTAISVVMFNRLIKESGALFASSVTYLIPVVGLGWGFWLEEEVNLYHFIAVGLILTGVWLINKK